MNDKRSSLIVVTHKAKFVELAKASMRRRLGHEYNFPSGADDMVWEIPNIDELGARLGSYSSYVDSLKPKILKYELDTFNIGEEELAIAPSKALCDELLELRVYARWFPINMLLDDGDPGERHERRQISRGP